MSKSHRISNVTYYNILSCILHVMLQPHNKTDDQTEYQEMFKQTDTRIPRMIHTGTTSTTYSIQCDKLFTKLSCAVYVFYLLSGKIWEIITRKGRKCLSPVLHISECYQSCESAFSLFPKMLLFICI